MPSIPNGLLITKLIIWFKGNSGLQCGSLDVTRYGLSLDNFIGNIACGDTKFVSIFTRLRKRFSNVIYRKTIFFLFFSLIFFFFYLRFARVLPVVTRIGKIDSRDYKKKKKKKLTHGENNNDEISSGSAPMFTLSA